jgi:hypothetical protein
MLYTTTPEVLRAEKKPREILEEALDSWVNPFGLS